MRKSYLNVFSIGLAGILLISAIEASIVPTIELDDWLATCDGDQGCYNTFKTNSTLTVKCISHRCSCFALPKNQPKKCEVMSNTIWAPCPCDEIKHSFCSEPKYRCECEDHFIPSVDKLHCLHKRRTVGEKCDLDVQCINADKYSVCDDKTHLCRCKNHVMIRDKCFGLAHLHQCKTDETCKDHDAHSFCAFEENVCLCSEGYIHAIPKQGGNISCLPILNLNEPCLSATQCLLNLGSGSECNDQGKCACDRRHYPKKLPENGKYKKRPYVCEPIVEIGKICNQDEDCHEHRGEHHQQIMYCKSGECDCKHGFNFVDGVAFCKSIVNSSVKHALPFLFISLLVCMTFN